MEDYEDFIDDYISDMNPGIFKGSYFNIMCVGMPGSGKTSFIKDIYIKYMRKMFDQVHVFAPTSDTKQLYEDMEPNMIFHEEEFDEKGKKVDIFDDLYLQLSTDVDEEGKKIEHGRSLIIIDDHYEKDINKNVGIHKLFTSGRHLGASIIFICQYYYVMTSEIMKNCTSIYVFFQNGRKTKGQIVDIIADELYLMNPDEKKKFYEDTAEKMYNEEVMKKKYHGLIITKNDGIFRYSPKQYRTKKFT